MLNEKEKKKEMSKQNKMQQRNLRKPRVDMGLPAPKEGEER
jgi:hypothetical protein